MLANLVQLAGVEVQGQVARLRATAESYKLSLKHELRHEIKEASVSATLAFGAVLCLFGLLVVALVALHLWVEINYGPFYALGAVAVVLALAAIVLALVLTNRMRHPLEAPPLPAAAVPVAAPPAAVTKPSAYAREFVPPLAGDASLIDAMLHRVSSHAAGATDDAIDVAADLVRKGSVPTLVATLAAAGLVGWTIGRRTKL
jgi:hypothetical protein